MDNLRSAILDTQKALKDAPKRPSSFKGLVGFDGFIDEICNLVDKRSGLDTYSRIETIKDFAARLNRAAGLSTNIEVVSKTVKLGGNGPIMSNALVNYGVGLTYIGNIGQDSVNPVFADFADRCDRVFPIAEPGRTDALEFLDGKVMMGKVETLKDLTWENILKQISKQDLIELFKELDLIALVNWTMIPYMNDIWEKLLSEVLPEASKSGKNPIVFFDLADPEKRNNDDIRNAVELIQKFSPYGRVVLGLNRKEASEIATVLGIEMGTSPSDATLQQITEAVSKELDIYCLVVHPTSAAATVVGGKYSETSGPYTSNPKLTTGAGDNFNAGFVMGLTVGLSPEQALVSGVGTSGYYVRNMHSPNFDELVEFLGVWAEKVGQDF